MRSLLAIRYLSTVGACVAALSLFSIPALAAPFWQEREATPGVADGASTAPERLPLMVAVATATERLEAALRDRGDYGGILDSAPRILDRAPEAIQLRRLHALALAADGDLSAAEAELAQLRPDQRNAWDRLARAMIERRKGRLDIAVGHADAALALTPGNAYAHQVRGAIASERGELEAARDRFARAAELAPEAALYFGNLGVVELSLGNLSAARAALATAASLEPGWCWVRISHAQVLARSGRNAEAIDGLRACLAVEPETREAARELVDLLLREGREQEAAAALGRYAGILSERDTTLFDSFLMAMNREYARAARSAGELQASGAGDPAVNIAYFAFATAAGEHLALQGLPTQLDGITGAVLSLMTSLNAAVAGQHAQTAIAFEHSEGAIPGISLQGLEGPQLVRLVESRATPELAAALGFYLWDYRPAAERSLERTLEMDSQLALPWLLRAVLHSEAGRAMEAAAALAKARGIAPTSLAAQRLSADRAMASGQLVDALEFYRASVAIVEEPVAVFRIGVLAENLGQDQLAASAYARFVQLEPDSFVGLNQFAWFLASRGQELDRALQLATRANSIRTNNASILDTLGWIHYLRGEPESAIQFLRRAFEISGWEQPLIGYHLARAEIAAGYHDSARSRLERIVAAGPTAYEFSASAQSFLERLP